VSVFKCNNQQAGEGISKVKRDMCCDVNNGQSLFMLVIRPSSSLCPKLNYMKPCAS
jgi:hypothetical protein